MDEAPKATQPQWFGSRLLARSEILVTMPTLVISLALAYFSFVQADATRKSQIAQTWPYVSYSTSNASPDGKIEITLNLSNDGVGPAQMEEVELLYRNKPMANPIELIRACCAFERTTQLSVATSGVDGVIRAGETRAFIRLAKTDQNAALWGRLNQERWKVAVRSCYCSIFDDCWVFDSRKPRPEPVKVCPVDWKRFGEMANPDQTAQLSAK